MSLTIRYAGSPDGPAIARIHAEGWRTAYSGFMPPDLIASRGEERRRREWRDWLASNHPRQVTFVAEHGEAGPVGVGACGAADENAFGAKGEVHILYVLPEFQGLGVGRRLLATMASWLGEHALDPVIIWTLRQNPNRSFYAGLGGHHAGERWTDFDGHAFEESAYLWSLAEDLKSEATRSVPV